MEPWTEVRKALSYFGGVTNIVQVHRHYLLSDIWWLFINSLNSINEFICRNSFNYNRYKSMICSANIPRVSSKSSNDKGDEVNLAAGQISFSIYLITEKNTWIPQPGDGRFIPAVYGAIGWDQKSFKLV